MIMLGGKRSADNGRFEMFKTKRSKLVGLNTK